MKRQMVALLLRWAAIIVFVTLPLAPAWAVLAGGTYVTTGATTPVGSGATLTLLQNGRVLITGSGVAELYDPAAGTWAATGNPTAARIGHTATLLQNGMVLVAGGYTGSAVLATTELYDPVTAIWTPSGTMTSPRYFATATLLANGKVLIAGGGNGTSYLNSADLYDPASGTVTATGNFTGNRFQPVSILLDNGKVLMTGGSGISTSTLYDPASGTWSATGSLAAAHFGAPLVKLASGKVLIAGGIDREVLSGSEIYDSATGVWSKAANMLGGGTYFYFGGTDYHSMVRLPNGQVLAAGGFGTCDCGEPTISQVYDPINNVWKTSGFPSTYHYSPTMDRAVLLGNGDVLFAPADGGVISELYRSILPRTKTDFNGDLKSDIVFENGAGTHWLYTMNGAAVQSAAPLPDAAPGWMLAGIGDFDGNGSVDLLWRNSATTTDYWIYLMDGRSIIGGGYVEAAPGYLPTYIADFNGDGKADILWENGTDSRWFTFMNGASVAAFAAVPDAAPGWEIAGVGNFDGVNGADLLWANTASPGTYYIYLLNGASVFAGGPVMVAAGYLPTWIGDMNRDGKADIIWENGANSRWVYQMNGTTLTTAFALPPPPARGWTLVGVGDFDNLGGLDLVWQNSANPTQYTIYLLSTTGTLIGNGDVNVAPGYVLLTH